MAVTINSEARARLDRHLDAVEQALAGAGNARERRRAVVDDLEAQIQEMLATRSATPTLEDVEAVLAKLDPPAAYGEAGSAAAVAVAPRIPQVVPVPVRPRYSRTAIWGLVCILVSFLPPLVVLPVGLLFFRSASPMAVRPAMVSITPDRVSRMPAMPATTAEATTQVGGGDQVEISPGGVRIRSGRDSVTVAPGGVRVESGGDRVIVGPVHTEASTQAVRGSSGTSWAGLAKMLPCFTCVIGPLGLLGTVLGWVAFGQIRASRGAVRGLGLALFDGLFYPVLAVVLFLMIVAPLL